MTKNTVKIILLILFIVITVVNCLCAYKIINIIHNEINRILTKDENNY